MDADADQAQKEDRQPQVVAGEDEQAHCARAHQQRPDRVPAPLARLIGVLRVPEHRDQAADVGQHRDQCLFKF